MCICVCVILQLHHTETMLRCGLPSEKEEGRKVSSDFVWLFFGEHAATVQYGCMWYYNYAMYILQCVIILKKKNHSLRFLLQRGGLLLDTKKMGNAGDVWDAGAPRTSRETSLLRMWIIRGVRGRGYVDLTGLPLLPSCLSSAVQVHILLYCIYGELYVCQDINHTCSLCCYATKKNSKILFCSAPKKTALWMNVCMHECELIIRVRIFTPCAAVLLYTPQLFPGSVVYRKKKRSMTFICFRYVSSCNTRRYLHNT